MSAVPETNALDFEQTLAQFNIGRLLRVEPVVPGAANQSYMLHTESDTGEAAYILTFADASTLPTSAFVTLLDRCADLGLPVAALIRTANNLPYATTSGNPAFLAHRLPGRTVYNPTLNQLQAVGRLAARFHLGTAAIEYLMPDFDKTVSWLNDRRQRLSGRLGFERTDLINEATQRVTSLLRRSDVRELPTGVIHGGLNRDSVLFSERGLTGIRNLENAAQGPLLYDLAVAANDWCNDSAGVLDTEKVLALLRGYQAVRPLTKHELWFLPSFALYAALTAWLSRLGTKPAAPPGSSQSPDPGSQPASQGPRFKNPNELQRIVRQHLAHAFYLDERLLT